MPEWEILSARWKVPGGVYHIALVNEPRGRTFAARFQVGPLPATSGTWSKFMQPRNRARGIGHSSDFWTVKKMCEEDYEKTKKPATAEPKT